MGRRLNWSRAGPDDPIYKEGLTIYTPLWARPGFKRPEPKEPPKEETEKGEKPDKD